MAEMFMQTMFAAFLAGTSCSICGASSSNAFLSVYILTHKQLLNPVWFYCLGKILSTSLLCFASSAVSGVIIDAAGQVRGVDLYLMGQYLILVVTVFLIIRWFMERFRARARGGRPCGASCSACGNGLSGAAGNLRCDKLVLFLNGLACGMLPCGPLIVMLGLCAGCSGATAIAAGAIFAATGFVSPVLVGLIISRLLASKLEKDAARCIPLLRLECYLLLLGVTAFGIVNR